MFGSNDTKQASDNSGGSAPALPVNPYSDNPSGSAMNSQAPAAGAPPAPVGGFAERKLDRTLPSQ